MIKISNRILLVGISSVSVIGAFLCLLIYFREGATSSRLDHHEKQSRNELNEINQKIEDLRNSLKTTIGELEQAQQANLIMKGKLEATQNKLQELKNELTSTKKNLKETQNQLDNTADNLTKQIKEYEKINNQLAQLQAAIKKMTVSKPLKDAQK